MAAAIIASVASTSVAMGEYCQLRKLRALSAEPKSPTGMPRRLELARKDWTCSPVSPRRLICSESLTGRTRASMGGMWKCAAPTASARSWETMRSYRVLYTAMRSSSVSIWAQAGRGERR